MDIVHSWLPNPCTEMSVDSEDKARLDVGGRELFGVAAWDVLRLWRARVSVQRYGWRISSQGTWCRVLSFIMFLAGCGDGMDVVDAFYVLLVVRFDNRDEKDGPAMLGRSGDNHAGDVRPACKSSSVIEK